MRPTILAAVVSILTAGCDRSGTSTVVGQGTVPAAGPTPSTVPSAVAAPAARGAVDPNSPKAAALAFFAAVEKGDKAGVRAWSTGSEARIAAMETISGMYGEHGKMLTAADTRFGADNRLRRELSFLSPEVSKGVEEVEFKVEGDTATPQTTADGRSGERMKRVGGGWRVDLGSDDDNETAVLAMAVAARKATIATPVFAETTEAIARGEYPTADAALDALMKKLEAAGGKKVGR